jgi:hypothetical protein
MTTPMPFIETDPIWFNQFQILFNVDRVTEFVPINEQTLEERLNSIARFGLFVAIILVIYKRNVNYSLIFPGVLLFTYLIYKNYKRENFSEIYEAHPNYNKKFQTQKEPKPTLNNPFMNTMMNDYVDNPRKEEAPTYYEDTEKAQELRNDITEKFNHDLYLGINDAYEKNNSQRQFYTTPNTRIPSDQEKYLNFMYPNMTSCKDEAKDCRVPEDLRGRPFIFPDQEQNPTSEKLL